MKWYTVADGVKGRMHNGEYRLFATDEDYRDSFEAEEEED